MNDNTTKSSVLIVDDNNTNLDVLFDYLDNAGFEVYVAVDGESAIERAQYTAPDIILLDVLMPGIDGFETCRRLKADDNTKDIPVVFMTALSDTTDKVKGFEVGAVDYVTKPLQYEEVLARVNTHLTIQQLQKDLQAQNLVLEAQNQELDAFAHTVAHDLKNPLTTIIGRASMIQMQGGEDLSDTIHRDLGIIIRTGQKMNSITDELLFLARVRDEAIDLSPVSMDQIIGRVQERLIDLIEREQAEIIMPVEWPIALGYYPWLEEVWANYISNAVKYGGKPPQVELGATVQDNGQVRFWVKDNGIGLTEEERNSLFAKFARLKREKVDGHGLGLSIVQRIVSKLGGKVGVEGEYGKGSMFYFTLNPLPTEEEDDDDDDWI